MKQESFINFDKETEKKYVDVHELALFLNVTPRRIQMFVKRGILPREKRGLYELMPCIHAYLDYLKKMIYRFVGYYTGKHNLGRKGVNPNTDCLFKN